jgi:sterol desaturase/sphingolipid hydroxylase (fatty acid hydroxylase superfamily)|tara:strand:- start:410 stop:1228 length:819 start_codon:yes stop_codon:yes gene_type:complete
MFETIIEHEPSIRLAFFFGTAGLVGLWQTLRPRRPSGSSRPFRWLNNFGITFLNTLLLRLLFPILAVGLAAIAAERGWGLLNMVDLPFALAVLIAVVLQDLVIYGQHALFHHVGFLWRFHKMHHADVDFDVSTGVRFHPVEIILSMLIKLLVVLLLGPPVVAVIIFEVILSSLALFNHANAGLPPRLDSIVRKFIVTPDMHRVHHSVIRAEHDSNFGFNLACWDYLFGTYRATPAAGHDGMTIGLTDYQENRRQNLLWMLALPFRRGQQTSR